MIRQYFINRVLQQQDQDSQSRDRRQNGAKTKKNWLQKSGQYNNKR